LLKIEKHPFTLNHIPMMSETIRLFYTDDDEEDRTIFREALRLRDQQASLTLFDNGKALLQHLREITQPEELPSSIVCDMKMPMLDGVEVLKKIKQEPRFEPIPVIILSTSSSKRDRDQVLSLGACAFFSKPNTFDEVHEMVEDILEISRTKKCE